MNFALGKTGEQFLEKVEDCIRRVLQKNDDVLPQSTEVLLAASRHLCVTDNAKRVRPMLTLLFGEALNLDHDQIILAAAAGELMHSASLLHDDVIDEAKTRRGRPTVSFQNGNATAVLAGNYLLSVAFSLLKEGPHELINDSVDAIAYMAKAAIAELSIRGNIEVSIDCWREIALGKTGVLFAWCGRAAGRIAKNEEAIQKFYQCGLHIGTAFQLVDDLRDLHDKKELKDRFSDLKNREPSYPILLALESPLIKNEIMALWANEEMSVQNICQLGEKILKNNAWAKTCEAVKCEVNAAKDALGHFIDTKGGKKINDWLTQLYQSASNGFV